MQGELFPEGAVLVFGGTGGIGRAVAMTFARAGADVAVAYRSKAEAAAQVVEEIRALGRRASSHKVDVRDSASVQAAVEAALAEHGRLHTIVLGAGPVVPQVPLAEVTAAQWTDAVQTELNGGFNIVQATLPHLRVAGGGSYVHLGSAGHLRWPDRDGLSVVPKAGNEALMQGVAREEGRHGVRANTVLVGVIEAGMFLELTRQGAFDQAWVDATRQMLAIKRWGQPEEIGHAAVYLASNQAAYVTGQKINVSGGYGI
jgi:3-oxoacyl-[acyl-carrier protein] reductase